MCWMLRRAWRRMKNTHQMSHADGKTNGWSSFGSSSRLQREMVADLSSRDLCSPSVLWWQWERDLIISLRVTAAVWFSGAWRLNRNVSFYFVISSKNANLSKKRGAYWRPVMTSDGANWKNHSGEWADVAPSTVLRFAGTDWNVGEDWDNDSSNLG